MTFSVRVRWGVGGAVRVAYTGARLGEHGVRGVYGRDIQVVIRGTAFGISWESEPTHSATKGKLRHAGCNTAPSDQYRCGCQSVQGERLGSRDAETESLGPRSE